MKTSARSPSQWTYLIGAITLLLALTLVLPRAGAAPGQQAYVKASNTGERDYFGFAVAVSGDTMVVGAYREASGATGINGDQNDNSATNAGAAYVYVRSGGSWIQQAYLKASNTDAGDQFGWAVAVEGDTVVVGAYRERSNALGVNGDQTNNDVTNSGAAYVFVRSGTNWTQQAYLKASNTGTDDYFGWSVGLSGNTIVVGAPFEDSNATGVNGNQNNDQSGFSGAAYVFLRNGTNWTQQAYLKASNTHFLDEFGNAVAISGDTLVVAAALENSDARGVNGAQNNVNATFSGAAYVFVRNGGNWSQQAYLKASNTETYAVFGYSIALWGDTVAVGAAQENRPATGINGNPFAGYANSAGAAYVFVRNGTNWQQQAYVKASNTGAGDGFGASIALSGDTLVVGANYEDSVATGLNGNQTDDTATNSSAAYVFVRHGTNWSQQAYLKASNTGQEDYFGFAAAVSGDTVVVGAYFEDSGATGINGNQGDNSSTNSGAVYVFTGLGVGPRLNIVRDGVSNDYFIRFTGAPDVSYRVQRATSLSGAWDTLATLVAPASGLLEYHDTNAPPAQAFYRLAQP